MGLDVVSKEPRKYISMVLAGLADHRDIVLCDSYRISRLLSEPQTVHVCSDLELTRLMCGVVNPQHCTYPQTQDRITSQSHTQCLTFECDRMRSSDRNETIFPPG